MKTLAMFTSESRFKIHADHITAVLELKNKVGGKIWRSGYRPSRA